MCLRWMITERSAGAPLDGLDHPQMHHLPPRAYKIRQVLARSEPHPDDVPNSVESCPGDSG